MRMVEVQLRNTCRGKYLVCTVSTRKKKTKNGSATAYFLVSISLHRQCSLKIWLTMRTTGRLEQRGIVLCSFAYKADDGQYFLTSLCQEKQQEQATHPEASLYLNTHLDSALGCAHHSKGCWSHRGTQNKDAVPATRASKQQQGQTLYFYSLVLGHTVRQKPDLMRW